MTRIYDEPHKIDGYAEPTWGIQLPTEVVEQFVLRTHRADACTGRNCVIHNPSDHPLKDAPLNWRGDRGLMERICDHGVGHPDPDDIAYKVSIGRMGEGVHGCCQNRCCSRGTVST